MLNTILQKWALELGELPSDYVTYDLETTGVDNGEDLIVELGHCVVIDRSSEEVHSTVLDWTKIPTVDKDWLKFKLKRCSEAMLRNGRTPHMTYERMQSEGIDPLQALTEYATLFDNFKKEGLLIAGHNAVQFDNPFFEQAVCEWLNKPNWKFPTLVFDTAAVVKATLTQMPPLEGESLQQYFFRVLDRPAPCVKYNLDTYCVQQFGLMDKHPELSLADAHTAGFDAKLTHLLLEEFRNMHESNTWSCGTTET